MGEGRAEKRKRKKSSLTVYAKGGMPAPRIAYRFVAVYGWRIGIMARQEKKRAWLALEDGSVWAGWSVGAEGVQTGEIVFNTSLTGYQEILTDPSYAGQMVVMTAPQIGNTGMNEEDNEAAKAYVEGFVMREASPCVSNWRARVDLGGWLRERGVMGIEGVDTRAITRRLRERGSLRGVLTTEDKHSEAALLEMARSARGTDGCDLVSKVTCSAAYEWHEETMEAWEVSRLFSSPTWEARKQREALRVVVLDFGVKRNILRRLASWNCAITILPAQSDAESIMSYRPDGILLSNGPGDPSAVGYAQETIKALLGQAPMFGICMGHQLLGLALGAKTYKLRFGHHGGNHPIKHLPTGRVEISAQNHNYAIETASLPDDLELTHINLHDQSCAGFRHRHYPIQGIQYHPEAAPGPHDADGLFRGFVEQMLAAKQERGGR